MREMQNYFTKPTHTLDMSALTNEIATLRAERDALRAERDALRTVDTAMVDRFLRGYTEYETEHDITFRHAAAVKAGITAALAVGVGA